MAHKKLSHSSLQLLARLLIEEANHDFHLAMFVTDVRMLRMEADLLIGAPDYLSRSQPVVPIVGEVGDGGC